MATFQELVDDLRIATHVNLTEVTDADMLSLAAMATRHINGLGALIDVNDDTILLLQDTWSYAIPAGFVYVQRLEYEDTIDAGVFEEQVPSNHWQLRSGRKIDFYKHSFDLRFSPSPGNNVRFRGQARATIPTGLGDSVEDELLAATQQAIQHLILGRVSQGRSELSFDRSAQRREVAGVLLELDLTLPDFRVLPNSRRVIN